MLFESMKKQIASEFKSNYTVASLKTLIISWAIAVIVITLLIDNEVLLASILAWEVLP